MWHTLKHIQRINNLYLQLLRWCCLQIEIREFAHFLLFDDDFAMGDFYSGLYQRNGDYLGFIRLFSKA